MLTQMKDTLKNETIMQTIIEVWRDELRNGHPQDLMDLLGGQRPVKDNRIVDEIIIQVAQDFANSNEPQPYHYADARLAVENTLQDLLMKANDHESRISVQKIVEKLLQEEELRQKYTTEELLNRIHPQGGGGGFFSGMVNKIGDTAKKENN
jgi:hypothetical protein